MARQSFRLLLVAVSLGVAAAGILVFSLAGSSPRAQAEEYFTIEASEGGFNPALCQVSRFDVVTWKNVGKTVRRIIVPDVGVGSKPLYDTGDIQPGETLSGGYAMTFGGHVNYQDYYDPTLKGTIQSPSTSNYGPRNCSPQAPTPTPSPTAQPTPTPVLPPRCIGAGGCAVAVQLARDEP